MGSDGILLHKLWGGHVVKYKSQEDNPHEA